MAPTKIGLDYFSFYVDLLNDRKLRRSKMKYGYLATMVYIALLSILYKDKGYYIDYSDNYCDDVVWEVIEALQGKYQPTSESVKEIIEDLVACELFSDDQFKSKTITSKRAQQTFYRATVDRKAVNIDFSKWLLSEDDMKAISERSVILSLYLNRPNSEANRPISEANQPINIQSKVEESKVKESKEESEGQENPRPPSKKTKHKYGQYKHVSMTNDEYQKLSHEYGEQNTIKAIKYLDEYIEAKGYKHNSSYLTIKKWVFDALKERGELDGKCVGNDKEPKKKPKYGTIL